MDLKKTKQASLENKRGTYFIVGLLISCSLILISFEWTRPVDLEKDLAALDDRGIDIEIIQAIRREAPKPKPKLPAVMEVIEVVNNEIELEPIVFDPEVTGDTEIPDFIFKDEPEDLVTDEPEIFYIVEEMPLFNGGNPRTEFMKYIARNMTYPREPAENGVFGRVTVQFDIDEKGRLVNLLIIRGVDPALDAEAIRVVQGSPDWTPGKQRGKAVKVRFTFPINFVLQ